MGKRAAASSSSTAHLINLEEALASHEVPAGKERASSFELVAHSGRFYIGRCFGDPVETLVDIATRLRKKLPQGSHDLEFDDDGYAAIADSSQRLSAVSFLEDLEFFPQLWRSAKGELVVQQKVGEKVDKWSLTKKMQQYMEVCCKFPYGPTHSMASFNVYLLNWPRPGRARLLWSVPSIYTAMGLTSYKGHASKWGYESSDAWEKYLQPWRRHCAHHFFHSRLAQPHHRSADPVEEYLDEPSLTTLGFIALLARWALAKKGRHGGLQKDLYLV